MTDEKKAALRLFVLSFLVSAALLGGLCMGLLVLSRGEEEDLPSSLPETYAPSEEDGMTVLWMVTPSVGEPPETFLLVRFDPARKEIRVLALPPELEATVNITTANLSGLYEYGGDRTVCDGAENVFSVSVDRYLRIEEATVSDWIDQLGGIEYTVEQEIRATDPDGREIRLEAGRQLLSGRKVLDLLHTGERPSSEQLLRQAELFRAGLERLLQSGEPSDEAFDHLVNTARTDLTNYDYSVRREALKSFFTDETHRITVRVLTGEYREGRGGGTEFAPDPDEKDTLSRWFSGAGNKT